MLPDLDKSRNLDLVMRVISAIVPATVAECANRFEDMERLWNDQLNPSLAAFSENIAKQLIAEIDDETDDLTHIQNLKIKLTDIYRAAMEEISSAIKLEMRMEMHLGMTEMRGELDRLRDEIKALKSSRLESSLDTGGCKMGIRKEFAVGTLPKFSFTLPESGVEPIVAGYESIADKVSFGNQKPTADIEKELLANNPLFARVSTTLDRAKKHEPLYTVDEIISSRSNRFTGESVDAFKIRAERAKFEFDDDTAEDDGWDKLLKDKLQAQW